MEESNGGILPSGPLAPRCQGEFVAVSLTIEPWTHFGSQSWYYAIGSEVDSVNNLKVKE